MNRIKWQPRPITMTAVAGLLLHCAGPMQRRVTLRLSLEDSDRIGISVLDERLCSRVQSLRIGRVVGLPSGPERTGRHWWFSTRTIRESFDEFIQSDLVVLLTDHTSYRITKPFMPTLMLRTTLPPSRN